MTRIITYLICFFVFWTSTVPSYATESAGEDQYTANNQYNALPTARVIRISPEEYPLLESQLIAKGYRQSNEKVLLAARYEARAAVETQIYNTEHDAVNDCADRERGRRTDDSPVNVSINVVHDMAPDGDGVEAAVVFVVIGTVVVIVWTLYAFKFLYDVTVGTPPCGRWSELNFTASMISSDADQHADFSGVHFMTGYRDGYTDIGISAEAGQSNILLTETGTLSLEGIYWMVGPTLRWRVNNNRNPSFYEMEFVAGTTEHEEVGLLAKAKAGFSFGIGDALRWGVNLGVLNINLNDNQGIITDRHRYYYLFGVEMGYRF
ncbi:MAG TPA: hypothetical protein VGE50_05360 [Gammaproteobacteria bacterium]